MTETRGARMRPRWTDLATIGFVLSGLGPLLLLTAVLGWSLDAEGEVGFFGVVLGVAGVAAVLSRFSARWTKIACILLAVLMMGGLWWTVFGLFAGPSSFFDFMSGLLVLPGALLALIGSVRAFLAVRRGDLRAKAEGRERKTIRTALAIVGVAALVSGILTVTGRDTVADPSSAAATVLLKDFEFSPTEVSVSGGSVVLVRNDDPFLHTFTVDALAVDETITPGSERLITVPAKPGTYILYCKPHTSDPERPSPDDMVATLRVT